MAMQEWQICLSVELGEQAAREFRVGNSDWPFRGIVVRWNGAVHAYANRCPHQGHALNLTDHQFLTPDGQQLICASHGAVFVPDTGLCVGGPCPGAELRRLNCRTDGKFIYVTAPASLREDY